MIAVHVTDTGLSLRILGHQIAAIHDDRTTQPTTPNVITETPRLLRGALGFMNGYRR